MLVLTLSLAACGSSDQGSGNAAGSTLASSRSASSANASAATSLVGQWQRVQQCSELERVMTKAHLRAALLESIAGDGWIPDVTKVDQIKDPAHPCRGSVARKHSHFFTADGQFGSLDAQGQQVDDDTYRLVGDDTVVIGKVTFHYRITGGDTLWLTPVIPKCAPTCFEAGWSVAVAYPGYAWQRVK
jgi:hypothetical protein